MTAASTVCPCGRRVHARVPGDPRRPQAQGTDLIEVLSDLFVVRGAQNGYVKSSSARPGGEPLIGKGPQHAAGSAGHHRKLSAAIQCNPPPWIAWIRTTGARGVRACPRRWLGYTRSTGFAGNADATAGSERTLHSEHSMSAAHSRLPVAGRRRAIWRPGIECALGPPVSSSV